MSATVHNVKPFWLKHPHLLRVWCLLLMPVAPLVLLVMAIVRFWRDIARAIAFLYVDLWDGVTHRLPHKPIIRPVAGFVGWFMVLALPFGAVMLAFDLFAPNAPLWAYVALYSGMSFHDIACRAHERKKASAKAGPDEHESNAV